MVDRKLDTTNGRPVDEVRASQTNATGQHDGYIVLSAEERAKGFVRRVRDTYKHVGIRPLFPTRELTAQEKQVYGDTYVAYETYPESESPQVGRFWTFDQLHSGCGTITRMGQALAETYARDPKFYGATFCVGCNKHLSVEEFVWANDGEVVGS